MNHDQYELLTPTEREVLRHIGCGHRPGEIAKHLGRSVSTINNHLQSARSKLAASDSLTAGRALLALEAGRQKVPRHELPMGDRRGPYLSVETQDDEDTRSIPRNEQSSPVGSNPLEDQRDAGGRIGDSHGDTRNSPRRRAGVVFGLTLLIVATVSLAPAMAETVQRIADLIYPLPH